MIHSGQQAGTPFAVLRKPAVHVPLQIMDSKARVSQIDSLQALRALAATTVIFDHIPYLHWGAFGVDIFFIVSGFVICHITAIDSSDFFLKRVFRIVPLYWLCTFCIAAVALARPGLLGATTYSTSYFLKSLFFIPYRRLDHRLVPMLFLGWTLQFEMLFYAIFGTALMFTKKYAREAAIAGLIVVALLGKPFRHLSPIVLFYARDVVIQFACGITCYILWERYGTTIRRIPLVLSAVAAIASYAFFIPFDLRIFNSYGPYFVHIPDFLIRGIPASLIVLAFLSGEGRIKYPAFVLLIGDASYSLYLLHPYILEMLEHKLGKLATFSPLNMAITIALVAVCYGCAIASYRLFEMPSNQFLRRRFLRKKPGTTMQEPIPEPVAQ